MCTVLGLHQPMQPCYMYLYLYIQPWVFTWEWAFAPFQMSDVRRLPDRLEAMLFRRRFPEEVEELLPVGPKSVHALGRTKLLTLLLPFAEHFGSHHSMQGDTDQ